MGAYAADDPNVVVRRARTAWVCAGDGAREAHHAPACVEVIGRGERYVEYLGETPAYQSGTRHCLACAEWSGLTARVRE